MEVPAASVRPLAVVVLGVVGVGVVARGVVVRGVVVRGVVVRGVVVVAGVVARAAVSAPGWTATVVSTGASCRSRFRLSAAAVSAFSPLEHAAIAAIPRAASIVLDISVPP
jgi:hypothetical protein